MGRDGGQDGGQVGGAVNATMQGLTPLLYSGTLEADLSLGRICPVFDA